MFRFLFFPLVILFSLLSCAKEQKPGVSFTRIKTLEYSRESHAAVWEALYQQLKTEPQKQMLLNSIGKTKNRACVPFLNRIVRSAVSDSLLKEALFALGQTGSPEAEKILLSLPFDSLAAPLQKTLLLALSQCGSKQTFSFFKEHLQSGSHPEHTLATLAHLYRKGIGHSFFLQASSSAAAYYLSYAADYKHIPFVVSLLNDKNTLNQKYLLKTLVKKAGRDSSRFGQVLLSDSLTLPELKTALSSFLSKKTDWKIQLYALPLVPFVKDSLLTLRLKSFLNTSNPHLFIAAAKASIARMSASEASSLLLSRFGAEKNLFLRAQLLRLLAGVNGQSAYRIIMQDLDRGTDRYKMALLDALAQTEMKPALRTVRQFIAVPNPRLVNQAFELLAKRNLIGYKEIKQLLAADAFSSVSIALEQGIKKKLKLSNEQLLNLYQKFNQPDAFEVQKSVLNYLSKKMVLNDSLLQTVLWKQASHPFIQRLIEEKFPSVFPADFISKNYLAFLPDFLQPDSLTSISKNPLVLIKTSRGNITVKLFFRDAPLTVGNFLHLVKSNFYSGLDFHRVIPDFVIQGGDPEGDGWGGTDYLIPSEDNDIPFERGSLGIATSGFDTGSCQFFICQSRQWHLTGNYTNFGRVIDGMSVVDRILPGDKILEIQLLSDE